MKRRLLLVLGCFSIIIFSSCVYQTQLVDVPLISEKNDLRVDVGIAAIPAAQATVSYGLTDKIAIQGYGSILADDGHYLQLAAGRYKRTNNRVLELYGGIGGGYGSAYNDANPGNLSGDYQIYFTQLNYGKIASEPSSMEIGFGLKTGYLHSNLTDQNYYGRGFNFDGPFEEYHDESILFEPVGFIRFGGEHFKFNVKVGTSLVYKFTNREKEFPHNYLNLAIGVNYNLRKNK